MLCRCQSEYRSDAAGVFSACSETSRPPTFPHLRPAQLGVLDHILCNFRVLLLVEPDSSHYVFSINSTDGYAAVLAIASPALSPTYCHCFQPSHLRAPRPYESLPCSSHNPTGPPFRITTHRQPGACYNNHSRLNVWLRC
jgi:hypothetical protein